MKGVGWVTGALIAARLALWAWRGALIIVTALQGLWSIALGASAAAGWLNVWAIRGNVIALGTLKTITWLAVAAQNAWNFALKVNPIFLMATAIITLTEAYRLYNKAIDESKMSKEEQFKNMDRGPYLFKQKTSFENNDESETWNKIMKINPKADDQERMDSVLSVLKGNINLNVNDPGGIVKDIKSDSSFIMPRVSATNGWN